MKHIRAWVVACAVGAAALAGCDDESTSAVDMGGGMGGAGGAGGAGGIGGAGGGGEADMGQGGSGGSPYETLDSDCNPLDEAVCALPWPSSHYLVRDVSRPTGFRLQFGETSLPANAQGVHVGPEPWTRLDGFGVGTPLMAVFPNLDITGIPGEGDIAASLADDAPILLFEVGGDTWRRVPYFAELDAQEPDPAKQLLFVRPAEVLKEDTHYVVAFRGLRDTDGEPIAPSAAFDAVRAAVGGADNDLTPRQLLLTEWLQLLELQGVELASLTQAWDFHTASVDAIAGPLVAMRDEALAAEPSGPEITITAVEPFAPAEDGSGNPVNPYTAYRLRGTVRFPNYLKGTEPFLGKAGFALNREGPTGKPEQDGVDEQPFWAIIPRVALEGEPVGFIEYGHGLFGDGEEVLYPGWTRPCGRFPDQECGWWNARVAQEHGYIVYGTDMIGMREEDRDERALTILTDITRFPWITDRLHQGILNHVLLARAVRDRFADLPEVSELGLTLNVADQNYYGNSQGSIFGVTVTALSPDIQRGYMGVAGANYATLLHRSTGFGEFFAIFKGIYTDTREQAVGLALLQLLWDATDSISYFRRLEADPLPNTPPSQILAGTTSGDYLVTPLVYEAVARTPDLGVRAMAEYDDRRTPALVELADYPREGSALVHWNLGNPWAPPGNTPPPEHPYGDPHEDLRHIPANQAQMVHFFNTGEVIDVCNGQVCPDVDRSILDD